jgi:CheY-like chemotaxis protein
MGKKLLLADDSVTIQKVVGISFANEDIELITVDNGDDAVTRSLEQHPDVVLADVVMPGKNGYEVCEALKSHPDLAHVPVLLLTGTFEAFDSDRAERCGAAGHIAKPFEAQALVDRVKELLSALIAVPVETPPSNSDDGATVAIGRLGVDASGAGVSSVEPAAADSFDFFDEALAEPAAPATPATDLVLEPDDNVFAFADAAATPAEAMPQAPATPVPDFVMAKPADDLLSEAAPGPVAETLGEPISDLLADMDSDVLAERIPDATSDPMAGTQLMSDDLLSEEMPPAPSSDPALAIGLDTETAPSHDTLASLVSSERAPDDIFAFAVGGDDPLMSDSLRQETVLDPQGASGYDVSGSDLIDAGDTNPAASDDPVWGFAEGNMPPVGGVAPDPSEPRPLAEMPQVVTEAHSGDTLDAAAIATLMDESSLEALAAAEPAVDFAIGEESPPAIEIPAAPAANMADFSDLSDDEHDAPADESRRVSTSHDPAALAGIAMAEIEPQLREQLHDTLEKIAWENLGAVTEQIINQAVDRIERAAWEVIPEMAETLIREEIRKMKGE